MSPPRQSGSRREPPAVGLRSRPPERPGVAQPSASDSPNPLPGVLPHVEREQLEQALSESEERYRRLTEICPDAVLRVRDNRIAWINDACQKLFAATSPEQLFC